MNAFRGMETDPDRIRELAEEREDENWEFRSFLKGCDDEKVDEIVHRLYEEIEPQIDCTACGNCCKQILPELGDEDIVRLAGALKISAPQFTAEYLVEAEEGEGFTFNASPCPLLAEGMCAQYVVRPKACVSYPHLHKDGFVFRLFQAVTNCSVCPIVFHVYERLKDEFHFKGHYRRKPT